MIDDACKETWHVAYTRSKHEKIVAKTLRTREIEIFLPTVKTMKIFSGKKRFVQLPLFPSYLFVKLENRQSYFDALEVPGIVSFVRNGKQLATVSHELIDRLNAVTVDFTDRVEVSSEHFTKGDFVNITSGPFTGYLCEIIDFKGKNKILVRIDVLQRSLLIDMPVRCLA
jgi:transcription antitermination factor NusG